jgi:subtilisin family serine protease
MPMKKLILFFSIIVCLFPKLFAQDYGVVCGSFHNTTYTDTLNGKSIQFPQQFLDSIQRFNVISYYQSYPGSKKSSLKSWITFKCPVNQTAAFASYLQTYETALFTEVDYELPDTIIFELDPIDYYWDLNRSVFSNLYGTETLDYMWHLKKIEADQAWNYTIGDPNVKIAILDYGFDIFHPDLVNKINPFDPYDHIPSDPMSGYLHTPNLGVHGTGVACLAAGKTNENVGWTASVGFNSGLVGYKIDDLLVENYMQKAFHAAFTEDCSVINISFKGIGSNSYIKPRWIEIIKEILDADKVIVRSAGNSTLTDGLHNRLPFSPVIDDRIIVVSSTNHHDMHADPSSDPNIGIVTHAHYPEVTICAPGYILTTATSMIDPLEPPYTHSFSGTSAATPIVSGVCALMKAVQPNLTVNEIKYIIQGTADPILDEYLYPGQLGAGRINAYKAVKAVNDCYTEPVLEKNITSIVNCSVPMRTSDPIVIQNGGELTISSTLKCSENVYIKVMPGGKLIINGGTLKNGCIENTWQGIVVEGTPSQTQMGVSQIKGL